LEATWRDIKAAQLVESAQHIHQHGQLAMPGICPDCNRYLLSCARPGVLQCDDFKSALQA
jgi:hypothetical protein